MAIHENARDHRAHSHAGVVPGHPGGTVIAHASGFAWDEALLIAAPLAVIAGLLALARHRVRNR